jgi:hypothetical protein
MARISFSALVEEIVGKLAGSVFQDSYGGFQIRTRVSPRNPQTKYQQLRRGEFGYLSAGWRFLTDVQRQTFIDAAVTPPAALNLYLQSNINLTLIEEPTITDYIPSSDPGTMTVEFSNADTTEMTIRATGATTVVPAGTKLLIQVTYQKAPTKIFTNPSQYSPVISFDEGTDLSVPTDILTEWQSRYGQIVADKRLCLKANLIDKSNGRRGADVTNCTIVEEMAKFVRITTDITNPTSSGTGLTDIYSYNIPANTLTQVGDTVLMYIWGAMSGSITNALIGWEHPGVTSFQHQTTSSLPWAYCVKITRTGSDSYECVFIGERSVNITSVLRGNATGVDFTADIPTNWQLQAPVSGTITAFMMYVNKELV